MKPFLFLAVISVIIAGALPSLPAKIILSAIALLAILLEVVRPRPQEPKNKRDPYLTNRH